MTETTREQRDSVRAALDNPEYIEFNESHILTIEGALDDLARAEELLRWALPHVRARSKSADRDNMRDATFLKQRIDTFLSGGDDND